MNSMHSRADIYDHLSRGSLGTLGTRVEGERDIRLRMMYYGVDSKFNFYLLSTSSSPKVEQILFSPAVSFLVFNHEIPFDASWEAEINGVTHLLEKKHRVEKALRTLSAHNPFADVALASGITSQFTLIALQPSLIRFRVYGEALKGVPPSIIQF